MKPLLLHLQNIGPFRSQSIDFTQLADMFLVCGKTGAGKSTIFNAITYALYGKLSGSHSQVNGARIRSDFASPDEEASITFTFQLQDQCYQVRRELPRDCINRNGKTTTKPESVEVYRKNGDSLQLLSSQKKEADTTLADLLGLTVDEFARIIILPQGEFAEFLKQNSNQRRETLMKLFPLDGYERLMEAIKARSNEDSSRLRLMETQLQGFGDFDLQQQEEILLQYQRLLQDSQNQRNELTEKQTGISVEIQACSQQLEGFLSHETLASKLELHVNSEDTVQRQRQHISLAERAAPVHAQIQSHQKTLRDRAAVQSQLDLTTAALKELEAEKERLQQQEPAIQQLRESHSKNLLLEQELARGLETEGELHRLTQRKELITDELTKLQRQQESLAARQVELEVALSQLQQVSIQDVDSLLQQQSLLSSQELECKTSLANAREELSLQEKIIAQQQVVENSRQKAQSIQQEFHRQQQQLESLREQSMAQILAAPLQPGKPCPVCGSTSHHLPDRPATLRNITVYSGEITSYEEYQHTFTGLRRGTYRVREGPDDVYTTESITVTDSTNCLSDPPIGGSAREVMFTMGQNTSGENVIGRESPVDPYTSYIDPVNGVFGEAVFTNTEIVYEGEIPVTKFWDDGEGNHLSDQVYVVLCLDDIPVLDTDGNARLLRLDAGNNWQGSFTVPLADKNDAVTNYNYSVREVSQISGSERHQWQKAILENDQSIVWYEKMLNQNDLIGVDGKGYMVQYEPGENGAWTVKNLRAVELPETGGMGTHLYSFSGLLMISAALIYGYSQRRKRERRGSG